MKKEEQATFKKGDRVVCYPGSGGRMYGNVVELLGKRSGYAITIKTEEKARQGLEHGIAVKGTLKEYSFSDYDQIFKVGEKRKRKGTIEDERDEGENTPSVR